MATDSNALEGRQPPVSVDEGRGSIIANPQQTIASGGPAHLRRGLLRFSRRQIQRLNLYVTKIRGWKRFERLPPAVLKIETTNICNADCIFCAYQYEDRPKAFMADALYRKSLEEYAAMGGQALSYVPIVGEPLIDKNFIPKIKLAKQHGMQDIYTYTNALLLHKFNIDELLTSGINRIIISTAPFDEQMYIRLYRNKGYPQLLKNLVALLQRNIELGRPVRITFHIRSYVDEKTALSLPDYLKYIRPYVNEATDIGVMLSYDSWGGLIKQEDLIGEMKLSPPPMDKSVPCFQTFTLTVLADGKVRACGCRFNNDEKDDPLIIGDVKTQSLQEIWRGEKLMQFRRRFVSGDLPSLCQKCLAYGPKTTA
jgi:MoaA/NifB/PqqE/SkfB family radical SAM enzyme